MVRVRGGASVVGGLSRSKRNQLCGSPGAERHISSAFPPGPRDCFHLRSPGATRKNAGLSRPASHKAPMQGARACVTPSNPPNPPPPPAVLYLLAWLQKSKLSRSLAQEKKKCNRVWLESCVLAICAHVRVNTSDQESESLRFS